MQSGEWLDQDVNMIQHNHEGIEVIALVVKESERISDNCCNA